MRSCRPSHSLPHSALLNFVMRRLKLAIAAQAEAETKLASRSSDLTQVTAEHEAVAHQLEVMSSRYVHHIMRGWSPSLKQWIDCCCDCTVADWSTRSRLVKQWSRDTGDCTKSLQPCRQKHRACYPTWMMDFLYVGTHSAERKPQFNEDIRACTRTLSLMTFTAFFLCGLAGH